jgi:hypothetical protein
MRNARRIAAVLALFAAGVVPAIVLVAPDAGAQDRSLLADPESRTVTSSIPAFQVKQAGGGIAMRAEITNSASAAIALDGVSNGTGHALLAWNLGLGRGAVVITSNSANPQPALEVSSQSLNSAAQIKANNSANTKAALVVQNQGRGPSATLSMLRRGEQSVSQAIAPLGLLADYKPGDVIVISGLANSQVRRSQSAYAKSVIGVVSTQPGVLLTSEDAQLPAKLLSVATSGIVMARVTAANGRIARGDLLVTSAVTGAAMRGTDQSKLHGAILGKALAPFSGTGTLQIPVMLTLG